jgi:7-keto-8-aminopelargonate synthetase-like enzyme
MASAPDRDGPDEDDQVALMDLESSVGAEIVLSGTRYVNFGGSSYLGLASNPRILEAGIAALRQLGAGGPIPRGHAIGSRPLRDVERRARHFFASDAALYLGSGYHFGLAAPAVLSAQYQAIFFDEFAHFALRDGIAASGLPHRSFRHLDVEDLEHQLRHHLAAGERPLIVTDGLYSTLGEIAPLDRLSRVTAAYGGRLVVDESHAFGVLGASGRGALEHHEMIGAGALAGGSLGKAFGTCGGLALGSAADVQALESTPVVRGASLGSPAAAAMCAASLDYVRDNPLLLTRLRDNTSYLKSGLRRLGITPRGDDIAPIASFALDSSESTQRLQAALLAEGIFVYRSTYIGAGDGGVIRCAVCADHGQQHLDVLLDALRRLL